MNSKSFDVGYLNKSIYIEFRRIMVVLDLWLTIIMFTYLYFKFCFRRKKRIKTNLYIFLFLFVFAIIFNLIGINGLLKLENEIGCDSKSVGLLYYIRLFTFVNEWMTYLYCIFIYTRGQNKIHFVLNLIFFIPFNLYNYHNLGGLEDCFGIKLKCPVL